MTCSAHIAWQLTDLDGGWLTKVAPIRPELDGYTIVGDGHVGGHGVVYKATEHSLGRFVAIKVLKDGAYASTDARERFLTEARAIASLAHPNIVRLFGITDTGNLGDTRPALVLEWVEGGTLSERLRVQFPTEREAVELIHAIALAVDLAHRSGILHRDIKPANILLADDSFQCPKLGDFGLAKLTGQSGGWSASTVILGTPSYLAPELAVESVVQVGPPVDIYSLGAVLYELLTGRPPHRGATDLETLRMLTDQEPIRPGPFAWYSPGIWRTSASSASKKILPGDIPPQPNSPTTLDAI